MDTKLIGNPNKTAGALRALLNFLRSSAPPSPPASTLILRIINSSELHAPTVRYRSLIRICLVNSADPLSNGPGALRPTPCLPRHKRLMPARNEPKLSEHAIPVGSIVSSATITSRVRIARSGADNVATRSSIPLLSSRLTMRLNASSARLTSLNQSFERNKILQTLGRDNT